MEEKATATAAPSRTYVIADRILAQVDGSGVVNYLLSDGHGSTQQITDSAGTITKALRYSAFGGAINFTLNTAGTESLFAGDAIYDPASGLYQHGDFTRGREGFRFIERDSLITAPGDTANGGLYLYTSGNPVNGIDPNGHESYVETMTVTLIQTVEAGIELPSISLARSAAVLLARGITYFAALYGAGMSLMEGANTIRGTVEASVDDAIWNEVVMHAVHHRVLNSTDLTYLDNLAQRNLGRHIYLHYGFVDKAASFAAGMWPNPTFIAPGSAVQLRSYGTQDVYATGWQAHSSLMLTSSYDQILWMKTRQ